MKLYDGYWSEETYFVRETDNGEKLSESLRKIAAVNGLLPDGAHTSSFQLGIFSVRPDGTILQYFSAEAEQYPQQISGRWNYVEGGFGCSAGVKEDTVHIMALDAALETTCWLAGVELSLVEATEERMVFDGPLNEVIKKWFGSVLEPDVRAIRTVWSKIVSEEEIETLKNAVKYVII